MVNRIEFIPTPHGITIHIGEIELPKGFTVNNPTLQTERPCANPSCGHSQFWHNPGCTYVDKETGDQCTCSWYE